MILVKVSLTNHLQQHKHWLFNSSANQVTVYFNISYSVVNLQAICKVYSIKLDSVFYVSFILLYQFFYIDSAINTLTLSSWFQYIFFNLFSRQREYHMIQKPR